MKKVILTEDQIKRMMDKLIVNEQVSPNSNNKKQTKNLVFYLLGYDIVESGGRYYAVDGQNNETELPFRDEIQGTIVGRGKNAVLRLDDLIADAETIGSNMRRSDGWNSNLAPLQTSGKDGWMAFMVRDGKKVSGNDYVSVGPYPQLAAFSVKGGLRTENYPTNPANYVKQKEGTIIKFRSTMTRDFIIELSPCMDGYSTYSNPKPQTPQPKETPIVLTFEKGLNDAFNFDQITLNDDGNKNLQDLINYAKQNYQGVSANVPVICSSSIDGDPNQKLKNGMTRSDYNMDLSKRRSDAIANMLTTQIGIETLKFSPQGIGETDKFDPGKKWPEVTDKLQTAGNRKLIIQLPKLQKTIQQK